MLWEEFGHMRNKYPQLVHEFDAVAKAIEAGGPGAALSEDVIADLSVTRREGVLFLLEALAALNILKQETVLICRCGEVLDVREFEQMPRVCAVCEVDLIDVPPHESRRWVVQMDLGRKSANERIAEERAGKARIAVITALPKEAAVMKVMMDDLMPLVRRTAERSRVYDVCETPALQGTHCILHMCLGDMGNNAAASRASLVLEQFPLIEHIVMLGIAGGAPNPTNPAQHVRLGDVVVSDRHGIIQFDFVKHERDEIIIRNRPVPPAAQLLDAVAAVAIEVAAGRRPWVQYLSRKPDLATYGRPDASTDVLIKTTDPACVIAHPIDPDRVEGEPRVFLGPIASSNSLLKNPVFRDQLRDRYTIKAVEMESSGIADATWERGAGYLAIRGICDYCDQSKGDAWQNYAALAAGAYLRALLELVPALAF